MKWIIAIATAALALLYVGMALRAPLPGAGYDFDAFGRVPVVAGGRVKPLDTVARNALMLMSHRQTFRDEGGKSHGAMRWFCDVLTHNLDNDAMWNAKVFRIEHEDVLSLMGLEMRPGLRYSLGEFNAKLSELSAQAQRANEVPETNRTLYQRKVLDLARQMSLLTQWVQWQQPLVIPGDLLPGASADGSKDWKSLIDGIHGSQANGPDKPYADGFAMILKAYSQHDPQAFNAAVNDYLAKVNTLLPKQTRKAELESLFNRAALFYHASVLYVLVFLLIAVSWLGVGKLRSLRVAGVSLLIVTLIVHTAALLIRMYLQGRPPVTNLYSSAVFVGWGAVVIGLFVEWIERNGLGAAMAAVCGFVTLLIAHQLVTGEDTMEMMRAVLDTNLWLATHVTCITIGYSATLLAGLLGCGFILTGLFTPWVDKQLWRQWASMIYGITCFALLFSFTGTVLGGIWADQSWGRFWGWDPKENGALLLVLANAILLHSRWAGWAKQRGTAVLAVFGNMVVAWSWFGVNMLGVGLHSYGFIASQQFWLLAFEISQLAIIGIGLLPLRAWGSPGANGMSKLETRKSNGLAA